MNEITVNGVVYVEKASAEPSNVQIVVLDRGFVYVGETEHTQDEVIIRNAKNIRVWGTTKGLGELVNGPLGATKTDDSGTVRSPRRALILTLDTKAGSWKVS